MADIGSIEAKVKLNTSEYLTNINKAEKAADRLSKQVSSRFASIQRAANKAAQAQEKYAESIAKFLVGSVTPLKTILSLMTGLAAAGAGALFAINKIANNMDKLRDRSIQLKVGVEQLQEFDYAAQQSGIGVGEADAALIKMQKTIGTNGAILGQLGLDWQQLANMSLAEQFDSIGAAINKLGTDSEKTAAQVAIFGRSGTKTTELLQSGVSSLAKEYQALGIALTQAQVDAADSFNDTKAKLSTLFDGFLSIATAEVLPVLTKITRAVIQFTQESGGVRGLGVEFGQYLASVFDRIARLIADVGIYLKKLVEQADRLTSPLAGDSALAAHVEKDKEIDRIFNPERYAPESLLATAPDLSATGSLKRRLSEAVASPASQLESKISPIFTVIDYHAEKLKQDSVATVEHSKKLKEASTTIEDMIKNAGKSELERILGKGSSDKPVKQWQDAGFDRLVKDIYNSAYNGVQGQEKYSLPYQLQGLQDKINSANWQNNTNGRGQYSTMGAQGALNELKAFVGQQLTGKKDQVVVKIEADANGILKAVVGTKEIETHISKIAEKRIADEAASISG